MLVSDSSLKPLPLDITCPQVVCPGVGTLCALPRVSRDLVPWCMIFLEAMHASGTFVPGPPPWEVISSRPMCSGVREPRTAQQAGLGVTFPCALVGAGWLVGPVCWAPCPPLVWLVGNEISKGGQTGRKVSVGDLSSLLDPDSFRGCGERTPRNILAGDMR